MCIKCVCIAWNFHRTSPRSSGKSLNTFNLHAHYRGHLWPSRTFHSRGTFEYKNNNKHDQIKARDSLRLRLGLSALFNGANFQSSSNGLSLGIVRLAAYCVRYAVPRHVFFGNGAWVCKVQPGTSSSSRPPALLQSRSGVDGDPAD